jgi:hypothetical protein
MHTCNKTENLKTSSPHYLVPKNIYSAQHCFTPAAHTFLPLSHNLKSFMVQNSYKATSTIFKLVTDFGELLLKKILKKILRIHLSLF